MSKMKSLTGDLKLALDPIQFAHVLGFDLDPWQKTALTSKSQKLLLCCSRQSGKSTVSALLALHQILYKPKSLVLLVSPSARQSQELFKKIADLMKSFPGRLKKTEDNKLSVELDNGSRCVSLPSSEGTIRGYSSVSLIIADESAKIPDNIFFTISPMISVSEGSMLMLSTPAGQRGYFWNAYKTESDEWEKITVDANQCPRISPKFLEREKNSIGDYWFKQEYLVQFMELEDSVFTLEQIENAVSDDFEAYPFSIKERFLCQQKSKTLPSVLT